MRTLRVLSIAAAMVGLLTGCVADKGEIRAALDRAEVLLTQIETELENARDLLDEEGDGTPQPKVEPLPADPLPIPLAGFNCPDHYGEGTNCDAYPEDSFDPDNIPTYNLDALPRRTRADDGLRQPVYHDHSQLHGIGVHDWGEHRRIFVGLDRVGESIARLPAAGARGSTAIRHGTLIDGVDRATLDAYLADAVGGDTIRWQSAPTIGLTGTATPDQRNWFVAAVELVNAALPVRARMRVVDDAPDIQVSFAPYTEFRDGVGATTWNTYDTVAGKTAINSSRIKVDRTAFASLSHRHFVTLISHELIHALGLHHVSADFDTLMEETREIYRSWQGQGVRYVADENGNPVPTRADGQEAGIPMPMSLLYPLDREALQVLYSRPNNTDLRSFGYWSRTSLHIAGNGEHANFGVALRNGLAQPWAQGYLPADDLADNTELSGAAAWDGTLVGLTPAGVAVTGDALIRINMAHLTGIAVFEQLEAWPAMQPPGAEGSGSRWGAGVLGYNIAVAGNTFRETGGDAGRLTGIFTGAAHEGAAGTLERADLTAAFGASR